MASPTSQTKPPRRAINPRYSGYLKPHTARIAQLANEGKSPQQIGRILYADGVRSPYDTGPDVNGHRMNHARSFAGLVYVMLGLRPKNAKEKLKRRIARTRQQLRALRDLERQARP
jgi:hypothetical protein